MLIVLTTTPTSEEAESLANGLVESRLAACVQILPKMTSVYEWQGKIEKADEEYLEEFAKPTDPKLGIQDLPTDCGRGFTGAWPRAKANVSLEQ